MVCRYNEPVIVLQVGYLIHEQSSHSNNTPEAYLSIYLSIYIYIYIVRQQDTIVTTKQTLHASDCQSYSRENYTCI